MQKKTSSQNCCQQNSRFLCQKKKIITDEFNKLFTNIETDLENKIPNASMRFDSYIAKVNLAWNLNRYQ